MDGTSYGIGNSSSIALGDFDGDGDLDAFVGANTVWLNDGNGNLTLSPESYGSGAVQGVSAGDLDGDGDLDLFVAREFDQTNAIYIGNGDATFTESATGYGSGFSLSVSLGDLDGDGDLDAFVANYNGQANTVWLSNSTPTDIALGGGVVAENLPSGTVVGALAAVDVDANDAHTLSLVDDGGGRSAVEAVTRVDAFGVAETTYSIVTTGALDYEAATSHDLTVRVVDSAGVPFERVVTIDVLNDPSDDPAIPQVIGTPEVALDMMFDAFSEMDDAFDSVSVFGPLNALDNGGLNGNPFDEVHERLDSAIDALLASGLDIGQVGSRIDAFIADPGHDSFVPDSQGNGNARGGHNDNAGEMIFLLDSFMDLIGATPEDEVGSLADALAGR